MNRPLGWFIATLLGALLTFALERWIATEEPAGPEFDPFQTTTLRT